MARAPRARRAEPKAEPEDFVDSESEAEAESEASGEEFDEEQPPTSIDPYTVLAVARDASEDQIRKAYRKLALKHHPDKGGDKETFQSLAFAYAILSDSARRSRYDATGSTSESILDADDDDFDWLSFYRTQFEEVITEDKIKEVKSQYKGSEDERQGVLAAYRRGKGNMDYVYEYVMLSNVLDDDERFRSIIDAAIETKELEALDKYTKESDESKAARVRKAENEAKMAERELKKMNEKTNAKKAKAKKQDNGMADLAALIQSNQQKRGGFMDRLEAKYGGGKRKRGPKDEPPEEAFTKYRAKGAKTKA